MPQLSTQGPRRRTQRIIMAAGWLLILLGLGSFAVMVHAHAVSVVLLLVMLLTGVLALLLALCLLLRSSPLAGSGLGLAGGLLLWLSWVVIQAIAMAYSGFIG